MQTQALWKDGLEDVIAGRSAICQVDGAAGRLYYRGYEIGELATQAAFEEVIHLLWFGELPSPTELEALRGHSAPRARSPSRCWPCSGDFRATAIPSMRFAPRSRSPPPPIPTRGPATPRRTCARRTASSPWYRRRSPRGSAFAPVESRSRPGPT